MKKILLSLVTSMLVRIGFGADNLPAYIKSYYTVKTALVAGNSNAASESTKTLISAVNAADLESSEKVKLLAALKEFAAANNISDQRKIFISVSEQFVRLAKQVKAKGVNVFFCPMKKAYWLGEEQEVKNPYYGNAMLTCGNLTETIK